MLGLLGMMDNAEERNVGRTEDVDGGIVDTCRVTDSPKPYETGIAHPAYNDGRWIIVETYDDVDAATAGHAKWVRALADKPATLQDANECQIGDLARAFGFEMRTTYPRAAR